MLELAKQLPAWFFPVLGLGLYGALYGVIRLHQSRAQAQPPPPPPDDIDPVQPASPTRPDALANPAQYVHEQLLLSAAATDAGACYAANDALVNALQAMGDFSGAARRQMEDRLRSVLLRRYSDEDGLCLGGP